MREREREKGGEVGGWGENAHELFIFTQINLSALCQLEIKAQTRQTLEETAFKTYTHTHTHILDRMPV